MAKKQQFSHQEGATAEFVKDGLRSYFEYRDLGIKDASGGDFIAHVVRAREGHSATGKWHLHECTFQMYYVLKGWARFEYEGHGVYVVKEGDCVLQPAGIRHREIEHSEDLEILEIVSPADFATRALGPDEEPVSAAK
jgi:mannose-6-phosphate isomerase-like protein (cupin superfamily)